MRRLFTGLLVLAFVSLGPPAFAFALDSPPDNVVQAAQDRIDVALDQVPLAVAFALDLEPVGVTDGLPGVELVQAASPGYAEPLGSVLERPARIDVPPPNVIEVRRVRNGDAGGLLGSQWRLTSVTRRGSL